MVSVCSVCAGVGIVRLCVHFMCVLYIQYVHVYVCVLKNFREVITDVCTCIRCVCTITTNNTYAQFILKQINPQQS